MKGFEKGLSPSKSNANHNLPSSGLVENDENDLNGENLIPQFANYKITHGKSSISGVPRKKILGEIKEISSVSDAQAHRNSNLESEKSPPKKGVSDSSVKVYDPLTNYLSPRPRYLRFNPNRRREILKRLEKELNSSLDSKEVSVSDEEEPPTDHSLLPLKGSDVIQRNGGICEEDNGNVVDGSEVEEEEIVDQRHGGMSEEYNGDFLDGYEWEEMEERGWCLRGILKLLSLIAFLLLSSYICPMNSPTDSPTQLAVRDFKDGGFLIKNQSIELVSMKLHGNGFFEVEDGSDKSIEEVEVQEGNYGETDESIEAEIVEYMEWHEKEMTQNENVDSEEDIVDNNIEEVEVKEENHGETDESIEAEIVDYLEWHEQDMVDEAAVFEDIRAAQFEHSIDAETDENLDGGIFLDMEVVSSSYTDLDEDNVIKDEAAEKEIRGGGGNVAQSSGQLIGPKIVESEDARGYMLEMETHSSTQLEESELPLRPIPEEIPTDSKGADDRGSHEELGDYMDEVDDIEDDDAEVGMEKSEWNTVVGVSAVLLVVSASLAMVYHSRKSRSSTSSKESEPSPKQKLAVEESVNLVLPSIDRKVEFLARASLPSHLTREAPRELASHIQAPIVELIGEIVVGQPGRVRRPGKFQMIVSEDECNAAASSQKCGSLPRLVPAPSQPSAVEPHPSTSFTTERKISKKEGGQSRDAMVGTTPVRRSSRLRNRPTVVSP